jgi:hypothetical protein
LYRDVTFGAGGGRLTKEAHDRAMQLNRGPLIGSTTTFEQPKRRLAPSRPMPRTR